MLLSGAQFETVLQVLSLPLNLAVVVAGTVLGVVLAPMARRCGVSSAVLLVLALPVAAMLDPAMGSLLLGSVLAASCGARPATNDGRSRARAQLGVVLAAVVTAIALIGVSEWVAARLEHTSGADKIALMLAAAAASVIGAAIARPAAWPAALMLCAVGLALQIGPLPPVYAEPGSQVPLPMLLGLLVAGPALVALAMPGHAERARSPEPGAEPLVSVLPVLAAGVPVTLAAAVLILNSEDYGLKMGPHLMLHRPKLVVALIIALILAALLSAALGWLALLVRRPAWLSNVSTGVSRRLAAAVLLALAIAALYQSGLDRDGELTGLDAGTLGIGALGMLFGAIAAWRGIDLAPLVVGLVIGRQLQPLLAEGLDGAHGAVAALSAGSLAYLLAAAVMIAAALAWPLLAQLRPQRVTP